MDTSAEDRARIAWDDEADQWNQWHHLGQNERDALIAAEIQGSEAADTGKESCDRGGLMQIAKLMDDAGRQISTPVAVTASVSWRASDGVAQAFGTEGQLIAEMHCARILWVEVAGMRIEGVELINSSRVRAMQWQVIF